MQQITVFNEYALFRSCLAIVAYILILVNAYYIEYNRSSHTVQQGPYSRTSYDKS